MTPVAWTLDTVTLLAFRVWLMTRISRSSRQMLVVAYPRLVIHDVQLPDKERDDTSDVAWRPQLQEVVISVRVDDAGYKFVVVSNTWTISVLKLGPYTKTSY